MAVNTEPTLEAAVNLHSPASLVRRVSLMVVDVSNGGCLFESSHPIEPGRTGTVRLALNGGWYVEDVRVTRCSPVLGRTSTYHIGAEFLRSRRLPDHSLRLAIDRMTSTAPGREQSDGQ